jgi:hypothetical protein
MLLTIVSYTQTKKADVRHQLQTNTINAINATVTTTV